MNKDNWVKVFNTSNAFRAEMIKGLLIENEVHAVVLNQIDSSYQTFGSSNVMVQAENEQKAMTLIDEAQKDFLDEN